MKHKNYLLLLPIFIISLFLLSSCGGDKDLYEDAESYDLKSGGKMTLIYADKDKVTDEQIEKWYFNHVEKENPNYAFIIYKDQKHEGVYAFKGQVTKDCRINGDYNIDYSFGGGGIDYVPSDGKLEKLK